VHDVVVGRRSLGTRLGYDRGDVAGPWLLKLLFVRRPPTRIRWSAVRELADGRLVVEDPQVRAVAAPPDA
jgi:hypothetical protein